MPGCCDDVLWIQERIAATKLAILAYEEAILALSTGGIYSYTLDTGQTKQTVTKQQLSSLRAMLDSLENRLQYWQHRLCGGASVYVKPAW
jgi:hypothetical protein